MITVKLSRSVYYKSLLFSLIYVIVNGMLGCQCLVGFVNSLELFCIKSQPNFNQILICVCFTLI